MISSEKASSEKKIKLPSMISDHRFFLFQLIMIFMSVDILVIDFVHDGRGRPPVPGGVGGAGG